MATVKRGPGSLASLRPAPRPSILPNMVYSAAEITEMLFTKYSLDADVLVIQKGLWFAAFVIELGTNKHPDDKKLVIPVAKVHYPGWAPSYDEWVMGDSMMPCTEENEKMANNENSIVLELRKQEKEKARMERRAQKTNAAPKIKVKVEETEPEARTISKRTRRTFQSYLPKSPPPKTTARDSRPSRTKGATQQVVVRRAPVRDIKPHQAHSPPQRNETPETPADSSFEHSLGLGYRSGVGRYYHPGVEQQASTSSAATAPAADVQDTIGDILNNLQAACSRIKVAKDSLDALRGLNLPPNGPARYPINRM